MRIVFCTDQVGVIVRNNYALSRTLGSNAPGLAGKNLLELFTKEDHRQVLTSLSLLTHQQHQQDFTAALASTNSAYHWRVNASRDRRYLVWTGTATAPLKVSRPLSSPTQADTPASLSPEALTGYLEKMSDALLVLDKNWRYTYLNAKAGELLGYDSKELIGQHIWTLFPEAVEGEFYKAAHRALETQQSIELTSQFPRDQRWFERRMYPSAEGLLIYFSDVTRKIQEAEATKKAQHELQNIRTALNASSVVSITDSEGKITWANDNFCQLGKYSLGELVGRTHAILEDPSQPAENAAHITETFKQGKIWRGETQNQAKDGSSLWLYSTIVPVLDEQGQHSHNIVFCQDITEKKKAERELAESERLYRTLIENYSDAVFLTDLQGNITKANQRAEAVSGMNKQALQGRNFLQFLSEDDRKKVSSALPLLLQGKNLQLKTTISCFQHSFSSVVAIVPIKDEGVIKHFFVKLRDISQKVNYEKDIAFLNDTTLALSNSSSLQEGTKAVIRLLCQYGNYQYGEFWMPLFGQHYVKMKSSWWASHKYRIMKAASELRTYDVRTDKPEIFGTGKWYFSGCIQQDPCLRRKAEAAACGLQSMFSVPVIYRNQLLGVFVLYARDERKQAGVDPDRLQELVGKLGGELERRNSAEELDRFFNLSPELLGIFCFDGYVKKFNPAFIQLLGYSEKEIREMLIREMVHPDDKAAMEEARKHMMQGRSYKNMELRYRCKDGSYRWLSCSTQSVIEENLVYLTGRDITVQKQQLEEIERIKIAIESTSDAIGMASDLEHCLYTNKSFERLLGWNVESLNALGWTNIFVDPGLPAQIVAHITTHGSWEGDIELYDTRRHVRDFNLRANTFLQDNGRIKYLIGIFTDISEQKQARQEVLKLSKAVEESENEIYILSPDKARFTYLNRRALNNLNYSLAEIKELNPFQINADYASPAFNKKLGLLLSGKKKSLSHQTYHTRKDGSRYPAEVQLSIFEYGQEKAVLANVVDISERRKAEEALKTIYERYQLVTRATNDAIWDCDMEKQTCHYGVGYSTLFGHSFGNTTAGVECWIENIHPEDTDRVVGNFHDVIIKKKSEWVIEYRFRCIDNTYKFVKDRGYMIYDETGKAIRATGALADISEQKRTEALLREFNAELERKVEEKTSKLGHALRLMRQEVIARVRTEEVLQHSLQEKEVLLKEIHHRVKNNMAIISGLLSLQARHTQHEKLKTILKDSQSRIKSMALIHELLYQHENLAKINFKEYIYQLSAGISSSFQSLEKEIKITIEAEDAEMDIVHAVPCALILNELITNCYKYAFAAIDAGEIFIGFKKPAAMYELRVADNGIGLPADFQPEKTKSLGMQLICNLTRQIGGIMEVSAETGAAFAFTWKEA